MIPEKEWKWFGKSAHFICGEDCRFHLATEIGEYIVSTVGELFPDEGVREIYAKSRGVALKGRGDERRYDYMKKIGYEDIGCERKYETMVFKTAGVCECGCEQPTLGDGELLFGSYNEPKEARAGHMRLCYKVAKDDFSDE